MDVPQWSTLLPLLACPSLLLAHCLWSRAPHRAAAGLGAACAAPLRCSPPLLASAACAVLQPTLAGLAAGSLTESLTAKVAERGATRTTMKAPAHAGADFW